MLKFIRRLLCPNRVDAMWLVVGLQVLCMVASVTLPMQYRFFDYRDPQVWQLLVCSVGGVWLAVAAALSWRSVQWSRTIVVLLATVAASLVFGLWLLSLGADGFETAESWLGTFDDSWRTPAELLFEFGKGVAAITVLAVVVWGTNRLLVGAGRWAGRGTHVGYVKENRSRVLIFVAIALFVLAAANNLRAEFFPGPTLVSLDSMTAAMLLPVVVTGYLLVCFWFSRCMSQRGLWLQKVISLCIVGVFAFYVSTQLAHRWGPLGLVSSVIGFVSFFLSLVAVGGGESPKPLRPHCWPSLWGAAIGIVMAGVAMIPWTIDLTVIATSGDWQLARDARLVTIESEGRLRISTYWGSSTSIWTCDLTGDAPDDVLGVLRGRKVDGLQLVGIGPKTDLSGIQSQGMPLLLLKNARVTGDQMEALMSVGRLDIAGDFKWESLPDHDSPLTLPGLVMIYGPEGTFGELLRGFEGRQGGGLIQLYDQANQADWDAVCKTPAGYKVYFNGSVNRDVDFADAKNHDLKNVTIQFGSDGLERSVVLDLLSHSNVRMYTYELSSLTTKSWFELLFYRGSSFDYRDMEFMVLDARSANRDLTFAELLDDLGLVFSRDAAGNVTGVIVPQCAGLKETVELDFLKRLSFDSDWIVPDFEGPVMATGPVDVGYLARLKNLEELWFDSHFVPLNLEFLARMKSLKRLQIVAVDRNVTGAVGFDACPTLESVAFFGWPDGKTILELLQIPNLQRVSVIDDGGSLSGVMTEDQLRRALGEIELVVLKGTDVERRVPEDFKQFRENRRKELGEDLRWLEELLAPLWE